MEYFDLLDENGEKTGLKKERSAVHRDGDLHASTHIWVIRKDEDGRILVLLQKRRDDKESFPGCLDISCAGHIKAGESVGDASLRELKEELGIEAHFDDLIFLFDQRIGDEHIFHDQLFKNYEINHVFLLKPSLIPENISFQEEEISGILWQDIDTVCEMCREVGGGDPPYCIVPEEIRGVRAWIRENGGRL